MKKILFSVLAGFCLLSSAAALSWGGVIDNNTKLSANDDFSQTWLTQSNGIYLSVSSNFTPNLRFAGEGMYKYNLNCDMKENETDFTNIGDVTLLKLAGEWTAGDGLISLNAGRYRYSDFSGSVFSQLSDGLYLGYDSQNIQASVYAGYTGLLNRLNVSMVDNEYDKDDDFYALCPKYVPVTADFSYKGILDTNTVGLQGAFFIPVTDKNTMKLYGTLIMNGYIGTFGTYDIKFTAGSEKVDDKFDGLMFDGKLDTNIYINTASMVNAGFEYVSGAKGDNIKPFVTLTARSFGGSLYSNSVMVPKLGLTYAAGKFYGNLTERVIITMLNDETKLDGFDTSASLVYNVFSDLKLGLDGGAYICKETKELSNYYATIKASLAF